VAEVHKVMPLKNKGDFLLHGVVLQNRVFRRGAAMFHVKHSCAKDLRSRDVSRETLVRKISLAVEGDAP
jgi:hypothetical protein